MRATSVDNKKTIKGGDVIHARTIMICPDFITRLIKKKGGSYMKRFDNLEKLRKKEKESGLLKATKAHPTSQRTSFDTGSERSTSMSPDHKPRR